MMAPGFRPVGWVAAVAAAALGCYMLSLNVASERADLTRIETQIVDAKQDIRTLQTELGTRGRMAQLEQWNGEVLALAAPTSGQFLDSEMKLARFDQRQPTVDERATVRMASVDTATVPDQTAPAPVATIEAPVVHASAPSQNLLPSAGLVRRASLDVSAVKQVATERQPMAADRPAISKLPAASKPPASLKATSAKAVAAARPAIAAQAPAAKPASSDKQLASAGRTTIKPTPVKKASAPVKLASASLDPVRIQSSGTGERARDGSSRQRVKASTGIDQSLAKIIGAAAKAESGTGRQ